MGFNSGFKGLIYNREEMVGMGSPCYLCVCVCVFVFVFVCVCVRPSYF